MRFAALLLAFLSAHKATAHEMLPANPVMRLSYVDGVLQTQMQLFNKRQDVEFYEVGVFDEDWNPVSFVTGYRIIRLPPRCANKSLTPLSLVVSFLHAVLSENKCIPLCQRLASKYKRQT